MRTFRLLLCMLVLAACQPVMPEAAPAAVAQPTEDASQALAEQLVGVWTGPVAIQINADGTYVMAEMSAVLATYPADQGQYTLDGTTLTFVTIEQSAECEAQATGTYTVEMGEDDAPWLRVLEDACAPRGHIVPGQYHRK